MPRLHSVRGSEILLLLARPSLELNVLFYVPELVVVEVAHGAVPPASPDTPAPASAGASAGTPESACGETENCIGQRGDTQPPRW